VEKVILDTNVLIEILKGNAKTIEKVYEQSLFTYNLKDFRYIEDIRLV
jgi:predicted nucleic acid-binding protein